MKKLIVVLLVAILTVLSAGVILVALDDFDDKVYDYAFVKLQQIELDDRLDTISDELSVVFDKSKGVMESDLEEEEMNKHILKLEKLISDVNHLKEDTEQIEIADQDVQEIHDYLLVGLGLLSEGTVDLKNACENGDPDMLKSASDKLSKSYSNVEEWRKLILEYAN